MKNIMTEISNDNNCFYNKNKNRCHCNNLKVKADPKRKQRASYSASHNYANVQDFMRWL